jgi:hypothetical protein
MAVALRGNLSDFGIGEVFQLIGQQRKSGILEVDGGDERIHVAFLEGSVVWAAGVGPHEAAALGDMLVRTGLLTPDRLVALERRLSERGEGLRRLLIDGGMDPAELEAMDELVTKETIFELLRWTSGSFHFSAQRVSERRLDAKLWPAEQILMDGLRMVDEWRTFDADARRADAVFRHRAPFEDYRASARGETPEQLSAAERLYQLLDGRTPARRATDLLRLGSFEGARLLSALRRSGVIEPVAREHAPSAARGGVLELRRHALAALPLAALALLAWLAHRPARTADALGLGDDPLGAARAAFAMQRIRNAAEAFRFAEGRWPRDLDELRARGLAAAMASPADDPYSMRADGSGFAVLAPER